MAYSITKNARSGNPEIVISGFENGIADSPYLGIADLRNINITTSPKQANVEFATAAVTLPPTGYTTTAFTADAATDIFTTATTAGFYIGMALTVVMYSGTGLTNGRTYYVGNITATTFKLYLGIDIGISSDVTSSSSGTFTVPTFGIPSDSVSIPSNIFDGTNGLNYKSTFIMTSDGLVWTLSPISQNAAGGVKPVNTLQFLGNLLHSTAGFVNQTGLVIFKGYLFAFMDIAIDYISLDLLSGSANPSANWIYAWPGKNITSSPEGHRGISATDDALYFCNNTFVGSLLENAGLTFSPTSSGTYTYNNSALPLPTFDKATCLSQLGTTLLVGGILNYIYPWNRINTSFNYPLIVAEYYIKCIVSTNSSAYIFAGNRGRIYITNGSNTDLFKKFPDSISGTVNPYYTWGWAIYLKNQIFFSLSATTNNQVNINNYAGIWAMDLNTKSLRLSNSLSYASYTGTVPVIVPMGDIYPTGEGIYSGWLNGTGGIDYTSANPYINYESIIDTDIIPVGTFYDKKNYTSIEFKLAKPLISGESLKISWRSNLNDAFILLGTTTTEVLSDVYTPNFSNIQWLQLRVQLSSTATNPSYVPLMEIRVRS